MMRPGEVPYFNGWTPTRAGVLVHYSYDNPISKAIAWAQRDGSEPLALSTHTGIWLEFSTPEGAQTDLVVESCFAGTRILTDWRAHYNKGGSWGVVALPLAGPADSPGFADLVRSVSFRYVDKRYDFLAIAAQFVDGMIGKVAHSDVYLARALRFGWWHREARYNYCTWLAAHTFGWTGWYFHALPPLSLRAKLGCRLLRQHYERTPRPVKPPRLNLLTPQHIEHDVYRYRPRRYRLLYEYGERPERRLLDCHHRKLTEDNPTRITP